MDASPLTETRLVNRWLGVSRALRRVLDDRYAAAGLSACRLEVLTNLSRADSAPNQTQLAEDLGVSASSLCALIERMRREGLLHRERSALDRRQSRLSLTADGERLCRAGRAVQIQFEHDIRESFSHEDLSDIAGVIARLDRWLDDLTVSESRKKGSAA